MKFKEWLQSTYFSDETSWRIQSCKLIKSGRVKDLDYKNLGDFLAEMAISHRRAVESRLEILICHALKWDFTPENRSNSWIGSIREQQSRLKQLFDSAVLKNYAQSILTNCYNVGLKKAVLETNVSVFPTDCHYTLEELLLKQVNL